MAILNAMLNQEQTLDAMFQALADPTRRRMMERLSRGTASVSELAEPFSMSLPAVVQHLKVLEESGLVTTQKVGRVRTCTIDAGALTMVEQWINDRRVGWEKRLDRLGAFLDALPPDKPAT
jgi:DNA-binding transcriptional ArsR family regulator